MSSKYYSKIILFAVCFFSLLKTNSTSAQTSPQVRAFKLHPKYIEEDFIPTGRLTNPIWQDAETAFLEYPYLPNNRDPVPVQTEIKVLYSQRFLYLGFRAHDPDPSKIRAHISEHDQIGGDDHLGILLDTYGNNQFGYDFFVTPKGVKQDLIRAGDKKNMNFDMLWDAYTNIDEHGYTAIFKLPFKGLHFPDDENQDWSVNFIRRYPRNYLYVQSWTDLSLADACVLCKNGSLVGLKGIQSSNPIDIIPYAMGYQSNILKDGANALAGIRHKPVNGRIGGTVIYSPTTTSSLDITVNPDFSQVESDATEISVNNTFALQYPEMRPFFLSNENLFQTGNNLFYSRTINQPLAAAKFTQAVNNYSLAFLTAYDHNVPIMVPGLLGSNTAPTGKDAYSNIVRGKINIGQQSHVGGLVTTRNFNDAHNYVGGLDWNFYLGRNYYLSGNAAYTETKELNNPAMFNNPRLFGRSKFDAAFNGEEYGGSLYKIGLARKAKIYSFDLNYEAIAPTFQAQNGFITRSDSRIMGITQTIKYYPKPAWFASGDINITGSWRYDYGNLFQERFIRIDWGNSFTGQSKITLTGYPVYDEWYRGVYFQNIYKGIFNISATPSGWLRLSGNMEAGRSIYRKITEMGQGYSMLAKTTLIPTDRLQLDVQFRYSELYSLDSNTKYYKGSISRLLGLYSFTNKFFFRLITQYDSFEKEIQIYPLVYYKINPFSKIYLGMTDYSQNFRNEGPPYADEFLPTHREFFIKIQYLIQK